MSGSPKKYVDATDYLGVFSYICCIFEYLCLKNLQHNKAICQKSAHCWNVSSYT